MIRPQTLLATALLPAVLLFAACSSDESPPPTTQNDGGDLGGPEYIAVSGSVAVHPAAVSWYQSRSQPVPEIAGLTLRVEEPLLVAFGDEDAVFSTKTLDAAGTFAASDVPVGDISLGLAGGIRDETGSTPPRAIRSATTVFDAVLAGGDPEGDITGAKVYVIPQDFHDQLTQAITVGALQSHAGTGHTSLISAGFILGRIIDAQGQPVAGAKVLPSSADLVDRFYYPTADLSSATQTGTSSNGLFVFVHDGSTEPRTFRFNVDKDGYRERNGGAVDGASLVVDVFPGATPP